jgi:hypothetical protein
MLKKLLGQNCLATSERQRCSALGCAGHQLGPQSLGLRSSRGAILCHERHILFIPHFLFHNVDICWHFHWHLTSDGNNPGKSKGNKHSICIICIICTAGTVQVRSLAQPCAALRSICALEMSANCLLSPGFLFERRNLSSTWMNFAIPHHQYRPAG